MSSSQDVRQLLEAMERELTRIGAPPMKAEKEFLRFQIDQGDALVALEAEFREKLVAMPAMGQRVYRRFIKERCDASVLTARPYFRARQKIFAAEIGPAMERADVAVVQTHCINYRFIRWVLRTFRLRAEFHDLAQRIVRQRGNMAILILPLALSRLRIFWGRTPRSHNGYLDLMDVAVEGCMAAIDKFVAPFTRTFRAVVIGRISTYLIDAYSQTQTHFYPGDKRMLYRANKLVRQVGGTGLEALDYEDLVMRIRREHPDEQIITTPEGLASMMQAASSVSLDSGPAGVFRAVRERPTMAASPAEAAEQQELQACLQEGLRLTSLVERKVLQLLGMLEA